MQGSRLELRLPKQKKTFFEHIATLGGFKTLTEFIMFSAEQQANKISEEHKKILATERDQKMFFDAIMNPPAPNQALKKAAKRYNAIIASK